MPLIIPAIIGGVGAIGGALISSSASNHASNVAAGAAAQDNALQERTYESNKALIQPAVTRGDAAGDELNGFLGLGGDPAKTRAAFDTYLNSTGYQFDRQQGLDGVNQSAAAAGLYNSGAALKALDAYGTGEAQKFGQAYAGNLNAVASRGAGAVNALTGAAVNNANQQSTNNTAAAAASASAGLAKAGAINGLIGNALSAYGALRGQSSFGGGGASATYNPFNPGG